MKTPGSTYFKPSEVSQMAFLSEDEDTPYSDDDSSMSSLNSAQIWNTFNSNHNKNEINSNILVKPKIRTMSSSNSFKRNSINSINSSKFSLSRSTDNYTYNSSLLNTYKHMDNINAITKNLDSNMPNKNSHKLDSEIINTTTTTIISQDDCEISPSNSNNSFATNANDSISLNDNDSISNTTSANTTTNANTFHVNLNTKKNAKHIVRLKLSIQDKALLKQSWDSIINDDTTIYSHNIHHLQQGNSKLNRVQNTTTTTNADNCATDVSISGSLFCRQFYDNLVAMDRSVSVMFPTLKHQARAFAIVINKAINYLDDLSKLDDNLTLIGKRHSRIFGISTEMFELMGVALIDTLRDRLTYKFNSRLENLWSSLYIYLANAILQLGADPIIDNSENNNNDLSFIQPTMSNHLSDSLFLLQQPSHNSTSMANSISNLSLNNTKNQFISSDSSNLKKNIKVLLNCQ
ncbi:hypothetical protein TBLA_0B00160 [Henningerozyma blattae CBS 6284]|uniref:Globin domain-containing protein n=1 Tax=Henningerozyma blattae (strain ATCC 34711 / CBS 6284 / DSM 70876 / NBRC 10599 / NRRL Y-10934 / UCD 77-7) TaxID=1071380 RepID=I2GXK9_HENB6|nr:hypothetical protein TBLA_0B00160 [Tetrapisispora blattae CBS 6284]CCH58861.1 hypothetical protein TBLA_0B00160 [Tetrapisispora blattae CBS 6284]